MVDKSWMLNPTSMRHAKTCIDMIRQKTGTQLKLSQPDFFNVVRTYVDEIDSRDLLTAYNSLLEKSSLTSVIQPVVANAIVTNSVATNAVITKAVAAKAVAEETVSVKGRLYPRWRDGKEFTGFYRGQPCYR